MMAPAVIILPIGHGKTSLHLSVPGLYDAAQLPFNKESVRAARTNAIATGDWLTFDNHYVSLLKDVIPDDCKILLLPDPSLAKGLGLQVVESLLLPRSTMETVLSNRPKRGIETSMLLYDQFVEHHQGECTRVQSHNEIRTRVLEHMSQGTSTEA